MNPYIPMILSAVGLALAILSLMLSAGRRR